jgi:hypothetical protein
MESVAGSAALKPPWEHAEFLTEDGLRAAQEYYFQTHATHSQLIAQGRGAQGLAKSFLRRRLSREMGEDFKMYTGTALGETTAPEDMSSLGIRGELNSLLRHIYTGIAPTKPISSPIQEDLTILKHPHGALEVCYAMVFYYGSLLRQYASFAANRRKVLKSLMDEELFKWVWRMVIGFMMQSEEAKLSLEPTYLSAGLAFVPTDRQRVPLGAKLHEIGMFLLSKTLQESHLRMPLCYYYLIYLRQLETLLALHEGRQELDDVYSLMTRRREGEPVEHPLVAIDALLNGKGSSMESFDDVLREQKQLGQYIPESEFAFINQFEDFGNSQRLSATLKRLLPDMRREQVEGQESSLMPLLLTLRVMPLEVRKAVLEALPIPLLNMLRNRIANSPRDDIATALGEAIREAMEGRKGQPLNVQSPSTSARGAIATSVRVAPPGGRAAPAAAQAASAPPAAASARAGPPAREAPAPAREAPARETSTREAAPRAAPAAEAPRPRPQEEERPAPARISYLDEPSLLAWRLDGSRVAAISLSARQLFELAGAEMRFLVAWVVFTLRTGQVFGLAPERVTKERVEQIVQALRRQAGALKAQLAPEQLSELLQQAQGASHIKLLLALVKAGGLQRFLRTPESLAEGLDGLSGKFGARLLDFLRHPNDEGFSGQRDRLTGEERQVLSVLQRVARSQQ